MEWEAAREMARNRTSNSSYTVARPSPYWKEMLRIYGTYDERCGHCVYCERIQVGNKSVLKCGKAYQSSSAASDWRAAWTACGMFEARLCCTE